jgi:predicted class III extradiol MEMO1 family dioxygenase
VHTEEGKITLNKKGIESGRIAVIPHGTKIFDGPVIIQSFYQLCGILGIQIILFFNLDSYFHIKAIRDC